MSQAAPALIQRRRNWALLEGTVLMVLAVVVNIIPGLYSLRFPIPAVLPWVNLALPALGVAFFIDGLRRAFGQPDVYRGKVLGSILSVVSALVLSAAIFLFVHVRNVPASAGAPKVGEKAPEFTLNEIHGQPVALSQLLAGPVSASGTVPKAVLLIFYRGYW